jgi:hypothetical protein
MEQGSYNWRTSIGNGDWTVFEFLHTERLLQKRIGRVVGKSTAIGLERELTADSIEKVALPKLPDH